MSSTGSFLGATYNTLCSQLAGSVCCASCSNQGPYHRHCGCSLHSGPWKLDGASSPKSQVKIVNKKKRSGMFRSISVQNLSDKSISALSNSGCSSETHSSFDESSTKSQEELRDENIIKSEGGNNLTVLLMEELATLIQQMKHGDTDWDEICCGKDHGSQAFDQKQNLTYRSGIFHSDTNLSAHAEQESESFPEAAPLGTYLPRFLPHR